MQIEDILQAALQDAGLESNLDILNSNTDFTTSNSNSANNSSFFSPSSTSSCTSNNKIDSNENNDLILDDLDLSLLSDSSLNYNTNGRYTNNNNNNSDNHSTTNGSSEASLSPNSNHIKASDDFADENDPFLLALKQLDEHNGKLSIEKEEQEDEKDNELSRKIIAQSNLEKNNNNLLQIPQQIQQHQQQQLPRKIIKINSMPSFLTNPTDFSKNIVKTQPIVKLVSINENNKHPSSINQDDNINSKNDLISLINFRNNLNNNSKPVIPLSNKNLTELISQQPKAQNLPLAKSTSNTSIKVINLSQINKPTASTSVNKTTFHTTPNLLSNSSNKINQQQQIIKIGSNLNDSNNFNSNSTETINGVKITKVVSSRNNQSLIDSSQNVSSNSSLVYIRKNNANQLVTLKTTPSVLNAANTLQSCKQLTSPYSNNNVINKLTNVNNFKQVNGNNGQLNHQFRYIVNNNPITKIDANKFTNTKAFASYYVNPNKNNLNNNNSTTNNNNDLHLNLLNSSLNRIANSNNINNYNSINNNNFYNTSTINNEKFSNTCMLNKNQNNSNTTDMIINSVINNVVYEPDEEVVVEEEEELGHAETYANYMPSKLKIGLRHPDPIVETSSLASVEPPDVWYDLKMPESVYANGALSALQLEAITYACQKHESFLPNNHRCGFLIGDGAGVGKGRTIAGIIYENYLHGRKKALWLSVSNDLKYDAQRDFSDIGAGKIQIHALNKLKYTKISSKQNSKIKKGVIFSTYSSLIGESQNKSTKKKYSTRLKQLLQWLGGESFDGVIVFDEAHKAKNLVPNGSAKPTKTGLAVLELQEKLPNARIVYASATGASEPKNMAYMVRLGLWGNGTPFSDFNEFIQSIEKRGVGAMEIVAMDMKLRGMYMARQLSFSGVTFRIEEIKLREEFIKMYDDAVKLWVYMKEKFQEAIELVDKEGKLRKTLWGRFWSSHQRFFKYLCIAIKVPHVVELSRKALTNNKCVVIGLQSTGEARTLDQLDEYGELNEFVSTAKGVLQNLVEKHFPLLDSEGLLNNKSLLQNETKNTSSSDLTGRNNYFFTSDTNTNSSKSFLDIMGVGDHIRQQLNHQKSKKERTSQKVNDILKRLSSYTNNTNKNLKYKNKKNKIRSSSMSSSSSVCDLFDTTDDEEDQLDEDDEDDENDEISSFCDDENDESDELDELLSNIGDEEDEELSSFEDNNTNLLQNKNVKTKSEESNINCNYITDEFEFNIKIDTQNENDIYLNSLIKSEVSSNYQNDNGFESDDSDSLFSITKSVSVQSFLNLNKSNNSFNISNINNNNCNLSQNLNKRKSSSTITNNKKSKKDKKTNQNPYTISNLNDNEEDDDEDEDEKNFEIKTNSIKKEEICQLDDLVKIPKKVESSFNFKTIPKPTNPKEVSSYLYDIRRDLLNAINQLGKRLPANTLDELIDLLDGPENVAEMTGRKGRIVSKNQSKNPGLTTDTNNNYVYETRNEGDVPLELMNIVQKERFMNGEKLIAIISEAASSGISLQANRRYANQFRRVHITIELPWSADRAVQQFGRTHRSNQVSAPEYIFLISELAGEKRFAATVAKRLESLGALTHGDRRATESRDLSRFNIDNKYGRSALENVIKSICNLEKPLARIPKGVENFMQEAREALTGVGMIVYNPCNQSYFPDKDYNNINKFLNRLLGCSVSLQNAIFTYFSDVLAAVILDAKRNGKWDMGILDLGSNNNEIAFRNETKFYLLNNTLNGDCAKRVEMHELLVERGLSWEKAIEIYKLNVNPENNENDDSEGNKNSNLASEGFYISNQIKNKHRIAILAVSNENNKPINNTNNENGKKPKNHAFLTVYRPNTGLQPKQESSDSLLKKYKKVTPEEAKSHWIEQYNLSSEECTHIFRQGHCPNRKNCEIGLRTRKFHVLAGSVLTVWSKVENLLSSLTGYSQFRLQIIRVKTDDNQKIVGCVIPNTCLRQIESLLTSMSSKTSSQFYQVKNNDITSHDKNESVDCNFKTSNSNSMSVNNEKKLVASSPILDYEFT